MQPSSSHDTRLSDGSTTSNNAKHAGSKRLARSCVLLGGIIICLLFFSLTNPKSVASVQLIVGFAVLAALCFCVWQLLLTVNSVRARLPRAHRRSIILAGTILPILLLMLQSIGQLTMRDVLTLVGLFLLGAFYVARAGRQSAD